MVRAVRRISFEKVLRCGVKCAKCDFGEFVNVVANVGGTGGSPREIKDSPDTVFSRLEQFHGNITECKLVAAAESPHTRHSTGCSFCKCKFSHTCKKLVILHYN